MDRRSGAREIVYFIDLDMERIRHVVPQQFEVPVRQQVLDILSRASEKIVNAQNLAPGLEQALAQVGSQKSGAAGDKDSPFQMHYRNRPLASANESGSYHRACSNFPIRGLSKSRKSAFDCYNEIVMFVADHVSDAKLQSVARCLRAI